MVADRGALFGRVEGARRTQTPTSVVGKRSADLRGRISLRSDSRLVFVAFLKPKGPDKQRNIFAEITSDPHYADKRNFYKLKTWGKDGMHITGMLYAGNNLEKAYEVFRAFTKKRPRAPVTIRQRTRVIAPWPK